MENGAAIIFLNILDNSASCRHFLQSPRFEKAFRKAHGQAFEKKLIRFCLWRVGGSGRWPNRGPPMITTAQCQAFIDQSQLAGTDPEISIWRATATMAVCRALMVVGVELAKLDAIIKAEER